MISNIKKIAFWWYRNIDVNGYLYISLKSFHIYIRTIIYLSMILTFSIGFKILLDFILATISNYSFVITYSSAITYVLNGTYGLSIFLISLIVTYESLYKEDVNKLIKRRKEKIIHIKENKLQWWRLRNKNIFTRISFYLFLSFILSQVVYNYYLSYVFENFNAFYTETGMAIKFNSEYEQQLFNNLFETGLYKIMSYAAGAYLIALTVIEFFIYRSKHDYKC
jgi:hypothetical protein